MATELAVGYVSVIPSGKGFYKQLSKDISGPVAQVGENASRSITSKLGGALVGITKKVGKAGLGIGAAFGGAALVTGYKRLTSIEDATASISTQLGSAKKGADLLNRVLAVSKGTPFSFDQFASATRTLVAMSVPAQKIPKYLRAMGEAAAASGQGAAGLDQISQSVGKIAASGQLTLEDVWSLSNSGVPALTILGNAFGKNRDEMKKMISSGAVPAEKALDVLTKGIMEGSTGAAGSATKLGGSMAALGKTTSGSLANAKAAVARFGADAIKPVFDRLPGVLQSGSAKLDELGAKVGPAVDQLMRSKGVQSVIDGIGPAFDRAKTAAAPFVGQVVDIAQSIGTTLADGVRTAGPPLIHLFTTVAPKIAAVAGGIGKGLAGALRIAVPILANLVKHGADLVAKVPTPVIAGLAAAFVAFKGAQAGAKAINGIADKAKAAKKGLTAVKATFTDAGANIRKFGKAGKSALDGIGARAMYAKDGIVKFGKATGNAASAAAKFAKQGLITAANWVRATAATVAAKAAQLAQAAATKIAAAAQWLFNAAMSANPIGLIVAGIAALVAGFVLAYQKVGWFRDLVNAVFNGIKTVVLGVVHFITDNWSTISSVLTAPFQLAKTIVTTVFNGIQTAVSGVINWVRTNWSTIKAIVTAPIRAGVAIVKTTISGIKATFTAVRNTASSVINAIVGFFTGLPGRAKRALVGLGSFILAPFTWGKDHAMGVINGIVSFVTGLPGKVKRALVGLGSALFAPFRWMLDKFKGLWNNTIGKIGFTVPRFIPKIGGKSWHFPRMHTGGIVPGGAADEPLIRMQGGEGVIPRDGMAVLAKLFDRPPPPADTAAAARSVTGVHADKIVIEDPTSAAQFFKEAEFMIATAAL